MTGLDHYFAGEFEPAINLWTRVLFLDRTHDRARAYIDRARSAQAEQQRISEALVHQGLEAFDKGEVVRARALLSDALDQGASHDVALGVLGRIDRLDVGHAHGRAACVRRFARRPFSAARRDGRARTAARGTLALWWATAAAIVLVAAISFVIVTPERTRRLVPGAGHHRRARRRSLAAAGAAAGAGADRSLPGAGARDVCERQAARCAARARSRAGR